MSISKIIYTYGDVSTEYWPHTKGFKQRNYFGTEVKTYHNWGELIRLFSQNCYKDRTKFIKSKPFVREDWM